MLKLPTNGYRPKSLAADLSLGIFDGLDNALWCYGFATVIFAGAMAPFLPLLVTILLLGWAMLGIWVAVTSGKSLHVVGMDEQAVVILAAISALLVAHLGADGLEELGLSTMLAVMSLSSVAVALFFWLIGHYRLTRLLELMPYPVICGFMAGIGWLLLEAGMGIAVGRPISELVDALQELLPGEVPELLQPRSVRNDLHASSPSLDLVLFIVRSRYDPVSTCSWSQPPCREELGAGPGAPTVQKRTS